MNQVRIGLLSLAAALLASAPFAAANPISPYNVVLGWDAATETGVDTGWNPQLNPLAGTQYWAWDTTNPVAFTTFTNVVAPGLTAAFRFDGSDMGTLSPDNPESIPGNPTDYSASIEMWVRPATLAGGRQLLLSFGAKIDGTSLTLENDILRFQVRDSDVRPAIGTNDGLEDLVGSIRTRLTQTNAFTHIVGTIELGGTNQAIALFVNGSLATPINDAESGLYKDESLVTTGNNFSQVPGTQGANPLTTRAPAAAPNPDWIWINDWAGNASARLGRQTKDVGATVDPNTSPMYLNDFKNLTFQGEIAVVNLYTRGLDPAQVAALYQIITQNRSFASPAHSASSLILEYNASLSTFSSAASWQNTTVQKPAFPNGAKPASDALDWKFATTNNLVLTNVSSYPFISAAYAFGPASADNGRIEAPLPDGTTATSLVQLLTNSLPQTSGTLELWFKPAALSGKVVLFETGGEIDGASLRLNGTNLEFTVRNGSNPDPNAREALASTPLSPAEASDFIQAAAVVDLNASKLQLFVNGSLRAEADFLGNTWADSDATGLGGIAGRLGGIQDPAFGDFTGQIAALRLYSRALADSDIAASYTGMLAGTTSNVPPTDILLSNSSVPENAPAGTVVSTVSALDANSGDTHAFALVSGPGDTDNASFTLTGATLTTAAPFDYETKSNYSIRLRATDSGGLSAEKPFAIFVENLNEANVTTQIPPNVILYMCDDMGIGEVGAYLGKKLGPTAPPIAKTLQTPGFDRLAEAGTLFTDVHTGSSMCSPTRYAVLTGRYAWRSYNKHTVIGGWQARPLIGPNRPTLATLLRQHGYRTSAFGKWHLGWTFLTTNGIPMAYDSATAATWATVRVGTTPTGYVTNILDGPLAHGFDYFFGVSGNFAVDSAGLLKAFIENNCVQGIPTWGGAPPQAGKTCVGPGVSDWDQQRLGEHYLNTSLGIIDDHVARAEQAPLFFYYVPNANHGPTDPASNIVVQGQSIRIKGQSRYSDGSTGANRSDMIYENSVAIGLLLDKLSSVNDPRTGRPMLQSTLLILTSDNGPDAFGVGQAGLRDKKTALYEGGHRIPFIAAWPDGGIPAGSISTANFGTYDLYASLSALLGHQLGPDEAEDSENVLPALLHQVSGAQFRRAHSIVSHDDSLTSNDLPNDAALAIREHPSVLLIDGKLVNRTKLSGANYGTALPIKLFDLDADLHQDLDLLPDPASEALAATLAERLVLFHNCGFSRDLVLTNYDQLLLTDGGADLRNDRSGAIGYEFTAGNQPVVITSLGLWDDGATDQTGNELNSQGDGQTAAVPDGLATPHTVRLFDAASQQQIAALSLNNTNSYLVGEFRYLDLPEPILLAPGRTYGLTAGTASGDGDLFHHFASFTGVCPAPSSLLSNFVARISATDGTCPSQYPDGTDGAPNRSPDMFRHRMFVGPNARIAPFRISSATLSGSSLVARFPSGSGMTFRIEGSPSLSPPDWSPIQTGIPGTNGYLTVNLPSPPGQNQYFYRVVRE